VYQIDWPGNIDMEWLDPFAGSWLRALRSFSRIITHDPRGIGLSSRNVELPTLETRVSDLITVLSTIGVPHPVLVGWRATGSVNVLAAATRPNLARAIVWLDPMPRYGSAEDFPWGISLEEQDAELETIGLWGTDAYERVLVGEQERIGNPPALGGRHGDGAESRRVHTRCCTQDGRDMA
jgi:pimeloyl-ACP methyl ester carboxylesterase